MGTSTLQRTDAQRYIIAGMSVILAMLAVQVIRPWIGQNIPPVVLAPWILLGAWYGGLWVGLVSTALNAIAAAYFLIPPLYSFRIQDPGDRVDLMMFAVQGVLVSWLCESLRRSIAARKIAERDAQQARVDTWAYSQALAQASLNLKHLTNTFLEADARRMKTLKEGLRRYVDIDGSPGCVDSIVVSRLVKDAIATFEKELVETHAEVICELSAVRIDGDESHLQKVFENLIDNAIKFRSGERLRIRITSERRKGQCVFSVSDNGIGMVPASWDVVFALGSRMHANGIPGAGMGLPIAKRIVENHGGRIWLTSEYGRGTTVRFNIPDRSA